MKLTLIITEGEEYFIGMIKEIPAVLTQGNSVQEVKENLLDALELYLQDMREESVSQKIVYQEDLIFAA
ncbi:type II toxin-antitoxin system HicB family antitoxin [Runella sp.]|jgi:predicted RNase H-like HicB family nuclease|uniref:type II toxin-antitoxin system HicB family antitoxin n=1 Tax=Runella sp. TaxID=1960881 RepID=UPI0026316FB1|nr:type II toxin-antitoxin system HicB family antitoxin [Runella sp.]